MRALVGSVVAGLVLAVTPIAAAGVAQAGPAGGGPMRAYETSSYTKCNKMRQLYERDGALTSPCYGSWVYSSWWFKYRYLY